jgi:hypothetical protein
MDNTEFRRSSSPGIRRVAAFGVLLLVAWAPNALAQGGGGSGDADVSLVYVNKTELFQQTLSGSPTPAPNRFTARVGANGVATRPNAITSGLVQKPGNPALLNLNSDGTGNVFLDGGRFSTLAALNAAFPNGTYQFNLQTATAPTGYAPNVTINNDLYPTATPTITSGTWASGGLQIEATQAFTFQWATFVTSFPTPNIVLQIVDDTTGALVFSRSLAATTTSVVMPTNTLVAGRYYTASLLFRHPQLQFQDTFTSWIATYARQTDFKIATIGAVPTITGPTDLLATVGQFFVYQVIASNHPFSYSSTALPPGLNFNSTLGVIHGVPTSPGTSAVQLTARNIDGVSAPVTLTPTIQAAPTAGPIITSSTSALGYTGRPFEFQVVARPATPAARITATGLPPGLVLDAITGIISGATNQVGSFPVNLTVRDGNFSVSGFLQVTFTNDLAYPAITNADTVTVPRGQPFTYAIATGASDPADPVVFSFVGTLPPGLSFNAATGTITGTYSGPLQQGNAVSPSGSGGEPPIWKDLSGGALLGSIQLFGTNSHGTSTFQLLFLAPPSGAVNISTRILVGTGENVLIGGFIITGSAPKVVIIRALGPSIGIPTALQDTVLQLNSSGGSTFTNDDWRTGTPNQEKLIQDTTIPPPDNRESAIVVALDPGNYTAIVSGKNGGTGIGLVEVYDLGTASIDPATKAQIAQISTRGNVLTGDNCMIGGFIVSGVTTKVLVRAIGPSLINSGITNALQNPTLELRDSNGGLVRGNDDWRTDQQQEIIDTTVPPTDDREAAAVASLVPNAYTAIVRGKDNTIGIGLVEVYALQ